MIYIILFLILFLLLFLYCSLKIASLCEEEEEEKTFNSSSFVR